MPQHPPQPAIQGWHQLNETVEFLSKAIFIKTGQVTEKWVIGISVVVAEKNISFRLIYLKINEVVSLKIDTAYLSSG